MEIIIDDIKINYIEEGSGEETVIVLHGWGASIPTIIPIVNLIKNRYKVYAIDLPGFGESEEPKRVYDSFDYANLVLEFMEKMDIEKSIFIGHSYGGKLSAIISSLYPEKVDKTVLIDASGLIPKRTLGYYLRVYSFKTLKFFYTKFISGDTEDEKMKKFYSKFGSDDYRDTEGIMRKIFVTVVNEDIKPLLKDIKCPTLLIWGDKDEATPLYMAEVFEEEIEDSGLVVLKDTGHYSYLDDYGTFSAVLNSFLQ
ncbi:MAG: alpha/beta hydrolase [Tissierellia bacterium]|nr:alpha/beta hydrolase [Tissierellia bacterium]